MDDYKELLLYWHYSQKHWWVKGSFIIKKSKTIYVELLIPPAASERHSRPMKASCYEGVFLFNPMLVCLLVLVWYRQVHSGNQDKCLETLLLLELQVIPFTKCTFRLSSFSLFLHFLFANYIFSLSTRKLYFVCFLFQIPKLWPAPLWELLFLLFDWLFPWLDLLTPGITFLCLSIRFYSSLFFKAAHSQCPPSNFLPLTRVKWIEHKHQVFSVRAFYEREHTCLFSGH